MKKTVLILLLLVLATAGGTGLMRQQKGKAVQATPSSPVVAVDVVEPSRATLRRSIEVYGSMSPKTATDLKSEITGRVQRVHVKEWDCVKPKDVLIEVDPTDFRLDLNKNEAGLQMAKAQLLQAKVDLTRAKREWNRALNLKAGGLITGQDVDERKTALESAEARVAVAQAQVGQAAAQVAEARRILEKALISSPIEGTISQRKADVGDFVDKGTPLFTIVDNRVLDFTATVPATDLPFVAEGQTLTFTVDGIPGKTFHGCIKRVNPVVNNTDRSGKIQAEVPNSEGILRGGLYARGHVLIEERKDVLALPKASLMGWNLEKNSGDIFTVDEESTVRTTHVTTGLNDDSVVEIRSGLGGNEKVVVRGGFNVRSGDKVHVANAEAK